MNNERHDRTTAPGVHSWRYDEHVCFMRALQTFTFFGGLARRIGTVLLRVAEA